MPWTPDKHHMEVLFDTLSRMRPDEHVTLDREGERAVLRLAGRHLTFDMPLIVRDDHPVGWFYTTWEKLRDYLAGDDPKGFLGALGVTLTPEGQERVNWANHREAARLHGLLKRAGVEG